MTINPKLTRAEKHELVSAILGSAFESYPWWTAVIFTADHEWDTLPADDDEKFLTIHGDDPEGTEGNGNFVADLSVNDIVKAYFASNLPYPDECSHCGDFDIDADEGDLVIQYAVYGTAVFS